MSKIGQHIIEFKDDDYHYEYLSSTERLNEEYLSSTERLNEVEAKAEEEASRVQDFQPITNEPF